MLGRLLLFDLAQNLFACSAIVFNFIVSLLSSPLVVPHPTDLNRLNPIHPPLSTSCNSGALLLSSQPLRHTAPRNVSVGAELYLMSWIFALLRASSSGLPSVDAGARLDYMVAPARFY